MNDRSDFRRLLRITRRRWAWLVFVPLVCSAAAFFVSNSQPEVFQASADIRISGQDIATDVALITSQEVNAAARDLIGDEATGVLSVSASTIGDTRLARITVRATTPEVAALAANQWAAAFADIRNEGQSAGLLAELDGLLAASELLSPELLDIEDRIASLEANDELSADDRSELADLRSSKSLIESQQRELVDRATAIQTQLITSPVIVTTTNEASEPRQPAEPQPFNQALFGLLGGLFLGVLAAWLAELLDDRIWEPSDLSSASGGLPVLASIPPLGRAESTGHIPLTLAKPQHEASEAFGMLGRTLRYEESLRAFPMIVATSALPDSGTSLVAGNLAAAFSQLGERVLLVDFRFRDTGSSPSPGQGIADAVESGRPVMEFVRPVEGAGPGSLWALPAGRTSLNPSNLAASQELRELLAGLRREFDRIIIDGGALLVGTEAVSVAENADGVCLAVQYRSTRGQDVERSLGRLDQVGVSMLGVVIWDAPEELFFVGPHSRTAMFDRQTAEDLNGPAENTSRVSWSE